MALFHYTVPARLDSTRLGSPLFGFPLCKVVPVPAFEYFFCTISDEVLSELRRY